MSNKKSSSKSSLSFRGFRGVDGRACQSDPPSAARLVNFFLRSDGSLEKRCGYRPFFDVGSPIRAIWMGTIQGEFCGYALLGETLYSINFSTSALTPLSIVDTLEGDACIFFYRGDLYLLDSTGFYLWKDGSLSRPLGYVPLVGKDWANNEIGPVYEPKNLLNPHGRISYLITDPPSIFLCANDKIKSVQAVYINGVPLSADSYTLDTDFNTVNVPNLVAGDRVVVHMTFDVDYSALLEELYSSLQVTSFGDAKSDRLFLWGGPQGNTVFCSSFVSEHQLKESKKHFPQSNELYFPEGFQFRVGSNPCNLLGAVRHFDRLLLLTDGETWMANSSSSGMEDFPVLCVNPQLGCSSLGGVTLAGNDPVSVDRSGIWLWSGDTEALNYQNARCLSREIEGFLSEEALSTASLLYDRNRDALWVLLPSRSEVWVHSFSPGGWSQFTGIEADRLVELDGAVGFLRGSVFYVFDPECKQDQNEDGEVREILAEYESNLLDFDSPSLKNLAAVVLRGDLDGGSILLTFSGNGLPAQSLTLTEPNGATHSILRKRWSSGRFLYGAIGLIAAGEQRQVIHSLSLNLRES